MKIFREAKGIPEPEETKKDSEDEDKSEISDDLKDWTVEKEGTKEIKESDSPLGTMKD
jgi:cell division protease FtsH